MSSDNDGPQDPISELAALASQQHEVFCAWVAAGFSEEQALELLKAILLKD